MNKHVFVSEIFTYGYLFHYVVLRYPFKSQSVTFIGMYVALNQIGLLNTIKRRLYGLVYRIASKPNHISLIFK